MSLTRLLQEGLEELMKDDKFRDGIAKDAIVDITLAFSIVLMFYVMSLIF